MLGNTLKQDTKKHQKNQSATWPTEFFYDSGKEKVLLADKNGINPTHCT